MVTRSLLFTVRWVLSMVWMWTFWLGQKLFGASVRPLPPIDDPVLVQSAATLALWIRTKKVTAVSVVKAYIKRAETVNQSLNAVVEDRYDAAMEEARAVDRKLMNMDEAKRMALEDSQPLLGVPFTTKESIKLIGMSHTGGLLARKGIFADEDAEVIGNLRKAGGIPLCVTNVPDLGQWAETVSTLFGRTNNPYDSSRMPGGSSGGEGALLSSCGTALSVGSDIGGSIRIPSLFCGVFGHKPTTGWVPLQGTGLFPDKVALGRALVVGPMARCARDLTLALQVMAPVAAKGLSQKVKAVNLQHLKIWWSDGLDTPLCSPLDPEVHRALHQAKDYLHQAFGATLHKMEWPRDMGCTIKIWGNKMMDDYRGQPPLTVDMTNRKSEAKLWREWLLWACGRGRFPFSLLFVASLRTTISAEEPTKSQYYWKPMQDFFMDVLREDGILLMPTSPRLAYYHHELIPNIYDLCYTALFNATEMPSTAVPLGLTKNNLPLGIQMVVSPNNDHLGLAVAEALQDKFGGWVSPAPVNV